MTASDPDVQALFAEEASARLSSLGELLIQLERNGPTPDLVATMFRDAHTIKGSAAVVGLDEVAREAHVLEELLHRVREGEWEVTPEVVDTILVSVDRLAALTGPGDRNGHAEPAVTDVGSGRQYPEIDAAFFGGGAPGEPEPSDEASGPSPFLGAGPIVAPEAGLLYRELEESPGVGARARTLRQTTARVPVERLDDLVRVAGESAGAHLRLAQVLKARLGDDQGVEAEIRTLTRLLTELHDKTLRARMLPIGALSGSLHRAVRDLARNTGKKVRLEIRGEDAELDRSVHEKLSDALVHIVRNAVDHGIETPEERLAAGKDEEGCIVVHAMQLGSRVIVTITDDGRGIDVDAVRRLATERLGIDGSALGEAEIQELLFHPGFSTAETVTDVSGRGVGLDAVRESIEQMRGRIEISSQPGRGTAFRIGVPITLAVLRGIMVEAAGIHFALAMHAVATVLSRDTPEVMVEGVAAVRVGPQVVALDHLASVLGLGEGRHGPIVVVTGLTRTHAFRVDDILGLREVVVKGMPPLIPAGTVVVGGSAEPDGSVLLVVDADGLIETAARHTPVISRAAAERAVREADDDEGEGPAPKARARARIMVVDDALTVRELQRTILERAGYEVQIAVDGVDALERLGDGATDLVLTDVEMPRMDGLTLTRTIRTRPQWANLPVVLLTTRAAESDRQAGMDAGADAYIVKSAFTEAALIGVVDSLLGTRTG